jgi:predicted lysophospholipase L1 biosynthesis ABC-type transport system permease subunit
VAIVNEQFAKTYWSGQDAIGKQLRLTGPDGPGAEVVGIAKTGPYVIPWEAPQPFVYLPYAQNPPLGMALIAESRGDPAALVTPLRDGVRALDPDMPISDLEPVTSSIRWAVKSWLIIVKMVAAMGLMGLILATVGLYGVTAYSVSRRTTEIGVRMAIGARPIDVLRLVLRQGLTVAVAGVAIGAILGVPFGLVLSSTLVGVGSVGILTFAVVPIALLAVSALACYLPARRAAHLDPLSALRYE